MPTLEDLETELSERLDEIKRKDDLIMVLEKEIDEKDALIRHLKNEIDKFQQVVRPLTKEIVTRQKCVVDEVEEPRKLADRPKRQAISAEPIINGASELPIVKIPKSSE